MPGFSRSSVRASSSFFATTEAAARHARASKSDARRARFSPAPGTHGESGLVAGLEYETTNWPLSRCADGSSRRATRQRGSRRCGRPRAGNFGRKFLSSCHFCSLSGRASRAQRRGRRWMSSSRATGGLETTSDTAWTSVRMTGWSLARPETILREGLRTFSSCILPLGCKEVSCQRQMAPLETHSAAP